jgi:hypothetical protein
MRTLYELKASRFKKMDDATYKRITESYIVAAVDIVDACAKFAAYAGKHDFGDYSVVCVKLSVYTEVVQGEEDETFFKGKIGIILVDEKTGREKKNPTYILIQSEDIDSAKGMAEDYRNGLLADTTLDGIIETKFVDYIDTI